MNGDQQSSLELLLDTITNTFGGILFLALLVVVLLQLTSQEKMYREPSQVDTKRMAELEPKVIAATRTRDELSRALALQEQLLKQFTDEASKLDFEKLLQLRATRDEGNASRLDLTQKLTDTQKDINAIAQELRELKQRLSAERERVQLAKRELESELDSRTTTARLPRVRETEKLEIAITVRYGRVYFVHEYGSSIYDKRLNLDDMIVLEEGDDEVVATPKPYAGIPISDGPELRGQLEAKLSRLSTNEVYLAVAVWEDSFADFIHLKNAIIALNYEYRLMPIEEGGAVVESSIEQPMVQ